MNQKFLKYEFERMIVHNKHLNVINTKVNPVCKIKMGSSIYSLILISLVILFVTSCGGSSSSSEEDIIPPYIDPNGGPVLKLDIGTTLDSSKKSKTNNFLKNNTESVEVFSLSNTLIGAAQKINGKLWQIQVPDTSPVIIRAKIKNSKSGEAYLEYILPTPANGTYYVNTDTTSAVALLNLELSIQGKTISSISSSISSQMNTINTILNQLTDSTYLTEKVNAFITKNGSIDAQSGINIIKLLSSYLATIFSIKDNLTALENGKVVSLFELDPSLFTSGGTFDTLVTSLTLKISDLKIFIDNFSNSIVTFTISGSNIKIVAPDSTLSTTISVTALDLVNILSLLEIQSNTAPVFTSSATTTATAGSAYTYNISATDADNDSISITASTLPTWLTLSNQVLSGTPSESDVGSVSITLSATDGITSTPTTQTFTITVKTATSNNAPKVISGAPTSVVINEVYSYTIAATDADGDSLTYAAKVIPSWLTFSTTTNELTGTPKTSNIGSHPVTLTVSDGKSVTEDSFTIIVSSTSSNIAPAFVTITSASATEDIFFTLTVSATDADNDTLSYASKTLPTWLTFDAATATISGTPSTSNAGDNTVTLTVTDGKVSSPVSMTFKVFVSTHPIITSTPVTSVIADATYTYTIAASDPDGDITTVTVPTIPSWMTFSSTTNSLSGAPTSTQVGVHQVKISATDNKSVKTDTQEFEVLVLSSIVQAKIDGSEVTDGQTVLFGDDSLTLSIADRSNSGQTLSILIDGVSSTLTNNSLTFTATSSLHTIIFRAKSSSNVTTDITVTLELDADHAVVISTTGGTLLNDEYRQIPGNITFSSAFSGTVTDTISSKSFLLDGVPQSLNNSDAYVLDPESLDSGSYTVKATINWTDSDGVSQTSSKTKTIELVENNAPTQTVKIDDLTINSDTSLTIHQGTSVTVTTTNHADSESDTITKGLVIDGTLNTSLTSYVVDLDAGETLSISTYLKDPYTQAATITMNFSSTTGNGGIPISLSATGTTLANSTTYRDKVNNVANTVQITASLGLDPEGDNIGSIAWYVNSVVLTGETSTTLNLDVSNYGGTTVTVEARVTDDFTSNPTTTTASTSFLVDADSPPVFSTATLDGVTIALGSTISVDHSSQLNKTYIPVASDPEGDAFTYQYTLSGSITTGSSLSILPSTLDAATLTVNAIQFSSVAATTSHNISANNVVPTPILIGNSTHTDLNGLYSLIVRPGEDIEGNKLTTTVKLNGSPIGGVVTNNEIQYSVDLTALGGTTAVFTATNSDTIATPVTTTLNVAVILSQPPTGLTAKRGSSQIILSWNSVNTATSYNLYYGTGQPITTGSTRIASITSPYTLTGLTNGTTYYFRISANHVSGEGTLSSTDVPMTPHAAGDTLAVTVNAQIFTFRYIPSGSFTQGSPTTEVGHEIDEEPTRTVTISTGFWMLQEEVNQTKWAAIITQAHPTISASPSFFTGASLPVEQITWEDIAGTSGFLEYLHTADPAVTGTSGRYRLPTEAEWEYACRSSTTTRFYWGEDSTLASISTYAWFSTNATTSQNVGGKTANTWGLFDMSGNVSEWTNDKSPSAYTSGSVTDPQGSTTGTQRIYRGGSWFESATGSRSANRFAASKDLKGSNIGFRFVRIALPTE